MATNKTRNHFDTTTLVTGIVAITAILLISLLANQAISSNAVYEKDPCRLIRCESRIHRSAENTGIDPFTGNTRCKCPEDPEAYYQVANYNYRTR